MSFPRYAGYTESQLEYIGPIPSSWDLVPFFSRFIERKESNKGMKNDNLLSLSYGRIIPKDINSLDGLLPASYETYQLVRPGDLVFRLTDLQNDKRSLRSAIVTGEGIITSAYLAVRPKAMNPAFASHLFRCYDQLKVFYSMGGGLRQSMKYDDMKWLPVVSPSLPEQTQIARFLDHETAKIDALIAEQKRLIKLLQEKRQAVISHAVTKGLDPNVPMKDSGVEWLGEVPAHWDIKSYKYACRIYRGKFTHRPRNDPKMYDGQFPFIQTGDVARANKTIKTYSQTLNDKGAAVSQKFPSGTLVMAIAANIGDIATLGFEAYAPDSVVGFKPNAGTNLEFLRYSLISALPALQQASTQNTQANLNVDRIGALTTALPPTEEQEKIVKHIEAQLDGTSELISGALETEKLLKERRSATISAAVTGKIDVRNWQLPADESGFDEDARKAGVEASA
ncbi:restriction endonuclease S subunit [Idiomarina sp. A28L]|uniref:restriction endonuclease subunit S n=1 Tax=Idiomarina sp. A28L TaxID=1036674 RepID=UPI0002138A43|nr:restriction endonuclease subunit S [Idiomarina sp. A28L]EGN74531.1 restriction endonuclease S subunit [Idiomarina sp. A28L]